MKTFNTLAEIQAHVWIGTHAMDSEAIKAVEAFVQDERNSSEDCAGALRCLIRDAMGEHNDPLLSVEDGVLLESYFNSIRE